MNTEMKTEDLAFIPNSLPDSSMTLTKLRDLSEHRPLVCIKWSLNSGHVSTSHTPTMGVLYELNEISWC